MSDVRKPLADIRVLDLTRLLPGDYASMVLAALGADVVKIEDCGLGDYIRLSGTQVDGAGSIHHLINRGKRSVALDLKDAEDRVAFEDLVKTSHLLLESFRPGTLARLGYPPERLHELRPDLVICSISGFGQTGPLASEPAHDINLMAWSGVLDRQRAADRKPVPSPLALADLWAGAACVMFSVPYVHHAAKTGHGAVVETSMAEVLTLMPTLAASDILAGEPVAQGSAYRLANGRPGYWVYPTRDGHMAVGAIEDKFYKELLILAGLEDMIPDRNQTAKWDAIRAGLGAYFAARNTTEIMASAGEAAHCLSPVQSLEAALFSDQAKARDYVVQEAFDPMPVLALPVTVDGQRLGVDRRAPRQGEHNAELLGRPAVLNVPR